MSYQSSKLSRRSFGLGAVSAATAGLTAKFASAQTNVAGASTIHRVEQSIGFPVYAYIVEGAEGLVVVDALLTDTASKQLRAKVDAIGKPLQAALLTHPNPDHYAGLGNLTAGLDVPIFSVTGVNDIVRRDDAAKDALISNMFGPEWPTTRVFPTETVTEGDTLNFGPGLSFQVMDIGPAESFHDSLFLLEGKTPVAFVGDLVFPLMHAYMADVQNPNWRPALDRVQTELAEDTLLFVGHGIPATPAFLQWQKTYLEIFDRAIDAADLSVPEAATAPVMQAMNAYLPSEDLAFLLQLSIAPNARAAGKL
ncbi:MAG: MBL fold metallo-hydrolase [Pseudomonadota bacterium]